MRTTVTVLFAASLVGLVGSAWAGPPESGGDEAREVNRVSELDVEQRNDGTYLRMRSSRTPSFSVFKLRAPLRLVVDVSNSRLEGESGLRRVESGGISRVSLLESSENGRSRVRLIVGFDRAAHYDVRTDGNDVVVFVEGGESTEPRAEGSSSDADLEQKRKELAEVRDQFEQAHSELEQTRSQLRDVRNRLSTARERTSTLRSKLEEATSADEKERLRSRLEQKRRELDRLETELSGTSQTAERLGTRVSELTEQKRRAKERVAELEAALEEQKEKARRRADELETVRAERREVTEKLETRTSKYREAVDRVEQLEDRLSRAESEIAKLERRRNRAEGEARARFEEKLERKSEALQSIRSKLERRKGTVSSLQQEVERLRTQRDRARKKVASVEKRWRERLDESQEKYRAARAELQKARGRLERAKRELATLEEKRREATGERRQELESKLARKSAALEENREELQERERAVEKLRDRVAKLERKKSERAERMAAKERQLEKTRRRVERVKGRLQSYRAKLQKRDATVAKLEGRIDNLIERSRDSEETGKRLERLRAKLEEQRRQVSELEEARQRQKELLAKLRKTKSRARRAVENQKERAKRARAKLDRYEERLEERDSEIAALESRVERLRERAKQTEGDAEERKARLEKLQRQLKRQKEQLAELRRTRREQRRELADLRSEESAGGSSSSSASAKGAGEKKRAARAVPVDPSSSGSEEASNTIRDIRLETENGESRIVVELERPGEYKRLPWRESRAVMMLNNVELPERLEQTIEANGDSGAVRFVSSFESSDGQVRMEAELESKEAEEKIRQEGDKLVWEFAPEVAETAPGTTKPARGTPDRPQQGTSYTAAPPSYPRTVVDPSKVRRVPGMSRKQITLDLHQADIHNVLRWFSKEGGINIIAGDGVSGSSTISLERVPLDQAFLIVLQSNGLGFEKRQDVIRVAPQEKLRKERQARQKAKRQAQKTRPLEVFLMPINYADAQDMVDQVNRLLSPRGSVSVDKRTNTLIIKDLPENIRSIRQLVGALDAQVPQVLIEARIVETNDTFSQEFGIQWGGSFTAAQGSGNPTGLVFPNVLGVAGGATDGDTPTQGTASNPNFAVNLPATAGTGAGGAIGLTMGSVSGSVNLNLRLSAAEESGRAKIISAPKILTLDNREATISQGTSIPISVVSAAGVQTVFVDATLELTVTPHVTPDGNVQLEISATKNEPDFQNTGARGDPTIIRKQAETELLIEDGETTVIGGIYTRNTGHSVTGVPLLHQIPILGLLFKKTSRSERRSELLIFITPRVVNRAEALGGMSAGNVVESKSGPPANGGAGGGAEGGGGGG